MPDLARPTALPPMFKWTGGKRREIERIAPHLPAFVSDGGPYRYVEPFAGGAALFFHLANPDSHLGDWDSEVMNFYAVAARRDKRFRQAIADMAALWDATGGNHDAQEAAYYQWRDLDRAPGGLAGLPAWKRAARFFIVNQLAFSGMRRFNKDGCFNVPFGHYRNFSPGASASDAHARLLKGATLTTGGYEGVLAAEDNPRTFVFVDPPYTRVMKKYSHGAEFGDEQQQELRDRLAALRHAQWMVVIDKSPLTERLYKGMIRHSYPVNYGANIKNRFSQAAEHVIATNYTP